MNTKEVYSCYKEYICLFLSYPRSKNNLIFSEFHQRENNLYIKMQTVSDNLDLGQSQNVPDKLEWHSSKDLGTVE